MVLVLGTLLVLDACPAPPAEGEGEGDSGGEGEGEHGALAINELGCDADTVELLNTGTTEASLSGLRIVDVTDVPPSVDVLDGVLAAGAFLELPLSFGLSCAGGTIELQDADGGFIDALTAPPHADDQGVGRLPDGAGAPVLTTPTPAAPNRPWVDASQTVFTIASAPVVLRVTVTPAAQVALEAEPYEYVTATLRATVDEGGALVDDGPLEVGLRIKGKIGSFRGCPFSCGDKSSFKLDLNRLVPGQQWRRIEKLNLNNQVQDPSRTHEWLAYEVFRAAGVPAPRTGFAHLFVNDEDFGLYALVEDRDDPFLTNHWPRGTLGLYEGEYGQDLLPGTAGGFDVDEGDQGLVPLLQLIDAIDAAPAGESYAALADLLDWHEVLLAMATEIVIGHWDGYAPTRNNYFLHVDTTGRWRLLPWGTDQTFAYPWPLYDGAGLLLQRCRADAACMQAWSAALGEVAAAVVARDFSDELPALAARLQPLADADPRAPPDDLGAYAESALSFLDARVHEVQAELACQADPGADVDGDGYACALDCDELEATRFVGSDDTCPGGVADGIDNDCNGRVDDGAACPDCVDRVLGASTYSFCRAPRTFAVAVANCAARGGTLAVVDSAVEWDAVFAASVEALGAIDLWIGLDDAASEGSFVWADGGALTDAPWAPGEPNDWNDSEDCAEARPDGLWNDLFCDAALPSICER